MAIEQFCADPRLRAQRLRFGVVNFLGTRTSVVRTKGDLRASRELVKYNFSRSGTGTGSSIGQPDAVREIVSGAKFDENKAK